MHINPLRVTAASRMKRKQTDSYNRERLRKDGEKNREKQSESVCLIISIYINRCCPGLRWIHEEKGSFGKIVSGGKERKKKEREWLCT